METEPSKNKKSNYWIILTIILLFVITALILSQPEIKKTKKSEKFSRYNQQKRHDNNRKKNVANKDLEIVLAVEIIILEFMKVTRMRDFARKNVLTSVIQKNMKKEK